MFEKGKKLSLRGAPSTALRTGSGDEAITFSGKDCFAEFILSVVEGLAMTRKTDFSNTLYQGNGTNRGLDSGFRRSDVIPAKAGI